MNTSLGQTLLCDLAQGSRAEVLSVSAEGPLATVALRLRDLGFVPGATCEVIARMWPGADPIAIRIAGSTFALRRSEASCVAVQLAAP